MNVPLWDDHALKAFLLTWEKENLWKGLNALFSQHNEHRIAFTRFITLFTFWVNGTLNYRILMAIGNLTLLGTWLLWAIRWKYHPDRWIWWAIGSWLLFTLALYENFYWGMASLQNFGIIFFALASFYGLAQKPKSAVHLTWPLWAGWFLGTIALFTSGNGLIVPLLGVVILIVQKRWKAFFWTGGLWAICLLLHLVTFTQRTDLSAPEPAVWNGLDIAWRFFVLAGSITDMLEIWPSAREGIAVAWGVLMTGITLIYLIRIPFQLLFKRYLPLTATQLMLGAFALFVLGTILGTILARLSYPVTILFTSKYKIYSNLLTLLAFSFVVFLLPIYLKRNWAWLCLGLSGLLYLNSYLIDFRFHLYTHQERTADLANLHFANQVGSIPMTQHPYQHPTSSLAASMANALMEPAPQWIDSVAIQPEYVHYFEFGEEMPGKAAYLVVRGDSSIQARPLYRAVQPNLLKRIFKPWAYSMAGTVSRMNLPSGLYETYIWQDKSGSGRWLDAQKTIRIKGFVFKEKPKNW